ncbi:MAG: hypothetical protein B1H11_01540 [Desulfobacteraceae bacterium 4484_190.1]|nr:MAG: hypothetical protein B1H11_01540 [Desulfobacteraceae bacterium 4484_190.1]
MRGIFPINNNKSRRPIRQIVKKQGKCPVVTDDIFEISYPYFFPDIFSVYLIVIIRKPSGT